MFSYSDPRLQNFLMRGYQDFSQNDLNGAFEEPKFVETIVTIILWIVAMDILGNLLVCRAEARGSDERIWRASYGKAAAQKAARIRYAISKNNPEE